MIGSLSLLCKLTGAIWHSISLLLVLLFWILAAACVSSVCRLSTQRIWEMSNHGFQVDWIANIDEYLSSPNPRSPDLLSVLLGCTNSGSPLRLPVYYSGCPYVRLSPRALSEKWYFYS